MLVHRLSRLPQPYPLHIHTLHPSPHGQHIYLWTTTNNLYLIEILSLLKYFQIYRQQFNRNHAYSFGYGEEDMIPYQMVVRPSRKEQHVQNVLVSEMMGGNGGNNLEESGEEECVVFVYLLKVQVVKIQTKGRQRSIVSRQSFQLPFQTIYTNIVGSHLFIAMYNLTQCHLNLSSGQLKLQSPNSNTQVSTPQTKSTLRRKQLLRLTSSSCPLQPYLWQTTTGLLMLGPTVLLSKQFYQQLDISNSYQEWKFRQQKDFCPIKYEMSRCSYYLIGADSVLYHMDYQSRHVIRGKNVNWAQIAQLQHKPQINPYWTYYQLHTQQDQIATHKHTNNYNNTQKILIAYYLPGQRTIVVDLLVIDLKKRRKQTPSEQYEQPIIRYESKTKNILSLRNVKHNVICIKWIGLCQLLYLEEDGQLYYNEFPLNYLPI